MTTVLTAVSAPFQSREWVELKVLELSPDITQLGYSLEEAQLLQKQHDEVLHKLAVSDSQGVVHRRSARPKDLDLTRRG